MIKRLIASDLDGTLIDSPMPDTGKQIWKDKTGTEYPHKGWWGRAESLDMNVFDIKFFPSILNQLNDEMSKPDTYVIILTSRLERLRPQVQAILDANNIRVDKLDMKYNEMNKGDKILEYINNFPDLEEVSVYDDRESDILDYKNIINKIPEGISFNIYLANKGKLSLIDGEPNNNLDNIVQEEIENFLNIKH